MHRFIIILFMVAITMLPLRAQEGSSSDRMGLLNVAAGLLTYTYLNVEDAPDDGTDIVNFGPNLSAALITGGFAVMPDLYVLARFGFNIQWVDGDWQESTFQFGPGIRYDFLTDPIVAYGGAFLSYALQKNGTGGGSELYQHYLVPELFVGAEVPVHDQFSIGGQFAFGYLHCWAEAKNDTPGGTVSVENELNGVSLGFFFSATVYF